ncbi:glycoside hydrolase family 13 protein [Paenibacillus sp. HB172176]|uniref:glycoside hydrolase family 13 protein n=1 Tax=Paenibacillus sp. HB172176 TaxID=2493690 RepID=UPI00143C8086|nr:glycoside hydrolase family 13 protein [Paenibacillus sp. HB172176]
MQREAIYHRAKQNWSYAYDTETIHIRIRTKRGDVEQVIAITGDKYAWKQTREELPMSVFASDELFDYWEAHVKPPFLRLRYLFQFVSGDEVVYRSERGFLDAEPQISEGFYEFPFLNPVDVFTPPAWVKEAVFYQIFPERFANGDASLNPERIEPWGSQPTPTNFFGGDLQGVLDHLDYLEELGINAIYFNPLFEATTNHKYDTADYMRVDSHFGNNEKLKELVEACHERGIRVMLDAVFNHVGHTFPAFVDVLKNGEASPYKDWFHIHDFPLNSQSGKLNYATFAFEPIMPKLNTENPEVKSYLLNAARYWIEKVGIDGWRLDVANEVDHAFWREFRMMVKEVNPEVYILGEIWHDSMMWLQGDQFDAVMNYPFTEAVLSFFARGEIDAARFAELLGEQLAAYPQQVTETAFNLLGSHDTPRLLTVSGENVHRMKLAALFQLTYPGAVCIYYGDEIGLNGGGDPDCRKCMIWEEADQNQELLRFFRQTIRMRRNHDALRSVHIRLLQAKAGSSVLLYERKGSDNERILIAMNAADQIAELTIPSEQQGLWMDLETGDKIDLRLENASLSLSAYAYKVLLFKS